MAPRSPTTHPEVVKFIRYLALAGWRSAAEIRRTAEERARAGLVEFNERDIPSVRTVQNVARPFMPEDASGEWNPRHPEAVEVRAVLGVLRAVIVDTEGRKRSFTEAEGMTVGWVAGLLPKGTPPLLAWSIAAGYLVIGKDGSKATELNALNQFVAFLADPQVGANAIGDAFREWKHALEKGWVDSPGPLAKAALTYLETRWWATGSALRMGVES